MAETTITMISPPDASLESLPDSLVEGAMKDGKLQKPKVGVATKSHVMETLSKFDEILAARKSAAAAAAAAAPSRTTSIRTPPVMSTTAKEESVRNASRLTPNTSAPSGKATNTDMEGSSIPSIVPPQESVSGPASNGHTSPSSESPASKEVSPPAEVERLKKTKKHKKKRTKSSTTSTESSTTIQTPTTTSVLDSIQTEAPSPLLETLARTDPLRKTKKKKKKTPPMTSSVPGENVPPRSETVDTTVPVPNTKDKTKRKHKPKKDTKKGEKKKTKQEPLIHSTTSLPPCVSTQSHSLSDDVPLSTSFVIQMDGSIRRSDSHSQHSSSKGHQTMETVLVHVDEEMGLTPPKKEQGPHPNRRCKWRLLSCCCPFTVRKGILTLLLLCGIAAAVVIPLFFLKPLEPPADGVERLDTYRESHVVTANLPIDICNEGYPGERDLSYCKDVQSLAHGGLLCNLVAKAMMNATQSEMAILNSGTCLQGIPSPQMTVGDIRRAITSQSRLTIVEIPGSKILNVLEQAMNSTFGTRPDSRAYPYASGVRYNVKSNLPYGSRLQDAEVDVDQLGLWRPINPRKFYKVVTTTDLANGMMGYDAFGEVIDHWKVHLELTAGDTFLHYTKHAGQSPWWDLDESEYSTQWFVAPDVEPAIARVPVDMSPLEACNLVAWSLVDQRLEADMAIIKKSHCPNKIESGDFANTQLRSLLPQETYVALVQMNGIEIRQLINQAIGVATAGGVDGSFPLTGGLRFRFDAQGSSGSQAFGMEVYNSLSRWEPLQDTKTYNVLTTADLTAGMDFAYSGFATAVNGNGHLLELGTREIFADFASDWESLYSVPPQKQSIQQIAL